MSEFRHHVERAIALHGSQAKLAKELGCSQQYISWLLKDADQISAEMAMAIDKATEGKVAAAELRPDLPWPFNPAPEQERATS